MKGFNHSFYEFLCVIFLIFTIGNADTIPANSCSQSDVQGAINLARDGDIVLVPEGNATWATKVKLEAKAITLKGAGIGKTVISEFGVSINGVEGKPFRISGFTFVLGTRSLMSVVGTCKNWRIDHCEFKSNLSLDAIIVGSLYDGTEYTCGVVDNCLFKNCRVIVINGDGYASWKRPLELGTSKAIYVEDCQFTNDVSNVVIDCNHGARYVFRYNTVFNSDCEAHSLQNANASGISRGTRSVEIYHNTFTATDEGPGVFMPAFIRSGTGVIFSNRVENNSGDSYNGVGCVDNVRSYYSPNEWLGECDGKNPLDGNEDSTGYPCLDQIGRSTDHGPGDDCIPQDSVPLYTWDNTMDGQLGVFIVHNNCGHHIKEGRDIIHNVVKPGYTPFTYPHPLTLGIVDIKKNYGDKIKNDDITIRISVNGLILTGKVDGLKSIAIFELSGRQVAEIPVKSRHRVFISNSEGERLLGNGCYILRLKTASSIITKRFITSF